MSARPCCREVYRLLRYRCVGAYDRPPRGSYRRGRIAATPCRRILLKMNLWALELRNSHNLPSGRAPTSTHPSIPLLLLPPIASETSRSNRPICSSKQQQYRNIGALRRAATHRSFFAIRLSLNNKRWSSPVVFPLTRHPRLSQMRRRDTLGFLESSLVCIRDPFAYVCLGEGS